MLSLLRSLHVLAVALWFGSVAFFTIAGLLIFQAFDEAASAPAEERPLWLPVPSAFEKPPLGKSFPDPTRREQGSRAAGTAVTKIFPVYYALQAGCAIVALLSAIALARSGVGGGHGWRITLVVLALLTVLAGWWLEHKVHELRGPRNDLTDQVLTASNPPADLIEQARAARAAFGMWHGFSLVQNFATLFLAFVLTLLLPSVRPSS